MQSYTPQLDRGLLKGAASGFAARAIALLALLGAEAIGASTWLDTSALAGKSGVLAGFVDAWGPWMVRCAAAFAVLFTTFAFLRYGALLGALSEETARIPVHWGLLVGHCGCMVAFALLSSVLFYGGGLGAPTDLIAGFWALTGIAGGICAALGLIPWQAWRKLATITGSLWVYALGAAALACYAGAVSWMLWRPVTRVTFELVRRVLLLFTADLVVQPEFMRIGTRAFRVRIAPECSGLEGAALFLMFGALWLFLFRKEVRFPRAFLLLPAGVLVLYGLNVVRIAALILIGHAGAREIAAGGFHSQAGWITFCVVAFGVTTFARRIAWISNSPGGSAVAAGTAQETADNPAAVYLLPFLALLAAGMVARAASGSFEWLYGIRLPAAGVALWIFRERYSRIDWKAGPVAAAVGVLVFALWVGLDPLTGHARQPMPMPAALAAKPVIVQVIWIALRIVVGSVIVPVAEELAFRGFLLRRLVTADFEAVAYQRFTWTALVISSVLFGLMHGDRWVAGTLAGLAYGWAAIRTGRLGEAAAAHAVTNALLAGCVLLWGQWYFW